MRILVVTNLYPPHHAGSFDLRCQVVADALLKRGHGVRVLTSHHGLQGEQRGDDVERRLILNGAYGHPLVTGYRELKAIELANHEILAETIREYQPGLVYIWSMEGLPKSFVFAFRNSRLPTVYDIADSWLATGMRDDPWLRWWNKEKVALGHKMLRGSLEASGERGRLDDAAPTRPMRGYDRLPEIYDRPEETEPNSIGPLRFDRVYFCSNALKTVTERAGYRVAHGEVIYPGIQTELFINEVKPESAPVRKLLIVGRLSESSGVMTALDAFARLRAAGLNLTLSVYGRGESDYIAQLRSFTVRKQLPVEFLNVSNVNKDLAAVYRHHDVLLYTSEWDEPFAVTPLEAMASGVPVIGALSGGAAELFRHGETALTYSPGDSTELERRIQELLSDPAARVRIAEAAQAEVVGRFNQSNVLDQIENYLATSQELWQQE